MKGKGRQESLGSGASLILIIYLVDLKKKKKVCHQEFLMITFLKVENYENLNKYKEERSF